MSDLQYKKNMSKDLIHTIEQMARLSRLAITEEEKLAFANSLESIIKYFDVLQKIDTDSVEPLYSVLDTSSTTLRDDVVEAPLSKEAFLKNAPSSVGGLIKVPQVLKQ